MLSVQAPEGVQPKHVRSAAGASKLVKFSILLGGDVLENHRYFTIHIQKRQ